MSSEVVIKLLEVALGVVGLAGAALTLVGIAVKGALTTMGNHMKHLQASTDKAADRSDALATVMSNFKDKMAEVREREMSLHAHIVDTCNETARMWKGIVSKG